MPIHLCFNVRRVDRERKNLVAYVSVENVRMSLRESKEKIGLGNYAAGSEAVLASQSDFPVLAQAAQFCLDQTRSVAA